MFRKAEQAAKCHVFLGHLVVSRFVTMKNKIIQDSLIKMFVFSHSLRYSPSLITHYYIGPGGPMTNICPDTDQDILDSVHGTINLILGFLNCGMVGAWWWAI